MMKLIVGLLFVGLNYYVYSYLATDEVVPERSEFANFSNEVGDWSCRGRMEMEPEVLANLGVSDYLICDYVEASGDGVVNVYVGYHATQIRKQGGGAGENSIHPPEHCLPGSGWDVIDSRVVPLEIPGAGSQPGQRAEAKRFIIAKGDSRQLVYFWYQSRGRILARNHEVILYRFWDRAVRQRTDGSLVRLTIPISQAGEARAEAIFDEFAAQLAPMLQGYIPN
jgi:EpsI family protein